MNIEDFKNMAESTPEERQRQVLNFLSQNRKVAFTGKEIEDKVQLGEYNTPFCLRELVKAEKILCKKLGKGRYYAHKG